MRLISTLRDYAPAFDVLSQAAFMIVAILYLIVRTLVSRTPKSGFKDYGLRLNGSDNRSRKSPYTQVRAPNPFLINQGP